MRSASCPPSQHTLRVHGENSRPTEPAIARRRHDRGLTLIEIVLAVTLMAILVIPLMATIRTSVVASSTNEAAANAETAIVDAADRINRAPLSCDYTVYAQASVQTRGWLPQQASVQHEHYDPTIGEWQPGGCWLATPTEGLVQRLVITITTPKHNVTRSIEVVKSNV